MTSFWVIRSFFKRSFEKLSAYLRGDLAPVVTMPDNAPSSNESKEKPDYRHAFQIFVVIGIILMIAAILRISLVPPTFGEQGFYRMAYVEEARDFPQKHVGSEMCADCHDDIMDLHVKDAHFAVPCEACHGPGWEHVDDPEVVPEVPLDRESCLVCHRLLSARPGAFPQVDWREHYEFVGVDDESISCTRCHSPHEPLFMDRDLRTARLHPLIHRCRDCHIGRIDRELPRPASHPAIFDCSYCHKQKVADFEIREHNNVECTTCHIFFKDSEFAGRIIRDSDPRFCLLCHRDAEFRGPSSPPSIEWPQHREDVSFEPGDENKRCIDCHRETIHAPLEEPTDE